MPVLLARLVMNKQCLSNCSLFPYLTDLCFFVQLLWSDSLLKQVSDQPQSGYLKAYWSLIVLIQAIPQLPSEPVLPTCHASHFWNRLAVTHIHGYYCSDISISSNRQTAKPHPDYPSDPAVTPLPRWPPLVLCKGLQTEWMADGGSASTLSPEGGWIANGPASLALASCWSVLGVLS